MIFIKYGIVILYSISLGLKMVYPTKKLQYVWRRDEFGIFDFILKLKRNVE